MQGMAGQPAGGGVGDAGGQRRGGDAVRGSNGEGGNPEMDLFVRMIQGIGSQLLGQQPATGSISEFLTSLGQDFSISAGEGLKLMNHL